jgi:hypothetical protein
MPTCALADAQTRTQTFDESNQKKKQQQQQQRSVFQQIATH